MKGWCWMSNPWSNSDAWQDDFEFTDACLSLESLGIISSEEKERLLDLFNSNKLSLEEQSHYREVAIAEINSESEANWVDQNV